MRYPPRRDKTATFSATWNNESSSRRVQLDTLTVTYDCVAKWAILNAVISVNATYLTSTEPPIAPIRPKLKAIRLGLFPTREQDFKGNALFRIGPHSSLRFSSPLDVVRFINQIALALGQEPVREGALTKQVTRELRVCGCWVDESRWLAQSAQRELCQA